MDDEFESPVGQFFSLQQHSDYFLGYSTSWPIVYGCSFCGVKQPGVETYYLLPFNTKVMNEWNYISTNPNIAIVSN
jgi:hypothetical protein